MSHVEDHLIDSGHDISVDRLSRDLRIAARTMGPIEARYLVDAYYTMQENRKRSNNQKRSLEGEPSIIVGWLARQSTILEGQIKASLDEYTKHHLMGSWMRDVFGVGPVISAGLLAHVDITKAPTVGHIWHFAGIAGDDQRPSMKGQKRPYNTRLKTLCWHIGQSFMKFSNNEKCYYGHVYRERKAQEIFKNDALLFKPRADISVGKVGETTEAYKWYVQGKLPPAHIDARARRYAVKLFLSHMHGEWYERHFKMPPPNPYPVAHLGHAHIIKPGGKTKP